jgi:hypothetical protein
LMCFLDHKKYARTAETADCRDKSVRALDIGYLTWTIVIAAKSKSSHGNQIADMTFSRDGGAAEVAKSGHYPTVSISRSGML